MLTAAVKWVRISICAREQIQTLGEITQPGSTGTSMIKGHFFSFHKSNKKSSTVKLHRRGPLLQTAGHPFPLLLGQPSSALLSTAQAGGPPSVKIGWATKTIIFEDVSVAFVKLWKKIKCPRSKSSLNISQFTLVYKFTYVLGRLRDCLRGWQQQWQESCDVRVQAGHGSV